MIKRENSIPRPCPPGILDHGGPGTELVMVNGCTKGFLTTVSCKI